MYNNLVSFFIVPHFFQIRRITLKYLEIIHYNFFVFLFEIIQRTLNSKNVNFRYYFESVKYFYITYQISLAILANNQCEFHNFTLRFKDSF